MQRLLLVLVIAAVAVTVALLVQRRHRSAAPTVTGYNVPDQIDRTDFDHPETPWLVVVFTSNTCETCAGVWAKARHLEAPGTVAVQEVEITARRDLHHRYRINGVPATVVVDASGTVRASFLGPVTAADLWATLAEMRRPGALPPSA